MRDHPSHSAYMMGGTWGAKDSNERKSFSQAFKKLFKDGLAYIPREKGGGYDQIALVRYVWPWAKKVALSHDAYTCHKFSNTSPFPTQRLEVKQCLIISRIINLKICQMACVKFHKSDHLVAMVWLKAC